MVYQQRGPISRPNAIEENAVSRLRFHASFHHRPTSESSQSAASTDVTEAVGWPRCQVGIVQASYA